MKILSHSVRVFSGVVLLLVLLAALALLALRLTLPHWDGLQSWVETAAGQMLQREVSTERIDLGWRGWSPALVAREVTVAMPGADPVEFEALNLSLSVRASLRNRYPALQLRARGASLQLIRHGDGRLSLHGHVLGDGGGAAPGVAVERWPDIELADIALVWDDRVAGLESRLHLSRGSFRSDHTGALGLHLRGELHGAADGRFVLGVDIPDARRRDARFYLDAAEVDLAAWSPWLDHVGWPQLGGLVSLELRGRVRNGRVTWLRGEHDTRLDPDAAGGLAGLGHRFDWRVSDGVHRSSWVGTRPGSGDLRLRYSLSGGTGALVVEALELAARRVEVEPYAPLLRLLEQRAPELAEPLERVRPRGTLDAVRFEARHKDGRLRPVWGEAELRDLHWRAVDHGPGLAGVDGYLQWRDGGAEIEVDSRNVRFEMPELFDEPLWLDAARGRLRAERLGDGDWRVSGEGLHLANADAAVRGRLRLLLDGHVSGPQIDLALDILRADGDYTARYLPVHHLPANTYRWLAEGIRTAHSPGGGMIFRGRPREFPFANDEGVFDLWADIEEGVLDYQPGWPRAEALRGRLLFHNAGFRAEGASGRILDTEVRDTTVWIDDMLRDPVLGIGGQAEGDGQDLLRYLRQAELLDPAAAFRDAASVEGPTGLGLDIRIPLQQGRVGEARVRGDLELRGNRIEVDGWPTALEAVRGRVQFDSHEHIHAEDVQARVHGEDVTLGADWPLDGGEARIMGRGPQALAPWLEDFPELQPWLDGRAHWRAVLRLGPEIDGVRLELRSDLVGAAIDLPEPLGKSVEASRALDLTLPLGHSAPGIGDLRLGDTLRARMRLAPAAAPEDPALRGAEPRTAVTGMALQAMTLELGELEPEPLRLPGSGLELRARLAELDVDSWLDAWERARWTGEVDLGGAAAAEADGFALERAQIEVDERIRWDGMEFPGARVHGRQADAGWDFRAQSDWLEGEAAWRPGTAGEADHWDANLRRFVLTGLDWGGEPDPDAMAQPVMAGSLEDPRAWPRIDLTLDSLQLEDYRLAAIRLELEPQPDGLQVRELRARAPEGDLRAQATGSWSVHPDGHGASQLDVALRGRDWGEGLGSAGLSRAMAGGSGRGSLSLAWPGPLYAPRLALLTGDVELALEDGRLVDVDPGAGRLMGLVSLDVLPRRLRLDFRDVFVEGFSFDDLEATAVLGDGDLVVPELTLSGPAAQVRVAGRTGLVARDYDHHIVVVPRLRTALPLVGAVLGGPVTGAMVLLVERVLGIGDQIEEASRVEYLVTGSWEEPEVTTLVEPADDND